MQLEDVTLIFAIIFVFLGALGQSSSLSALESTKCIVGRSLCMQGGYEQERKETGSMAACFSQSTYAAHIKHPDDTRGEVGREFSPHPSRILCWGGEPGPCWTPEALFSDLHFRQIRVWKSTKPKKSFLFVTKTLHYWQFTFLSCSENQHWAILENSAVQKEY